MTAPGRTDTHLVRQVAAYLCRSYTRQRSVASSHPVDPRYRVIRQAAGHRDLLRTLEAAPRPAYT